MSTAIPSREVAQVTRPTVIAQDRQRVRELQNYALFNPVEAFVARSGKRIRQSLVQLSYRIAGGLGEAPDCLAKSIELLHAGALVIDDIQDDSNARREQSTMHRKIGLPLAINAGNWMYFAALEELTRSNLSPKLKHQLISRMVAAGRQCHEGQACDLAARVDQLMPANYWSLATSISRQKTGCLVSLATTFGAVAADADLKTRRALSRFGMEIGVALQMRNDLAELVSLVRNGYESIRCDDLLNARVTWPWAWAARYGQPDEVDRCLRFIANSPKDTAVLVQVAARLLKVVSVKGNKIIRRRIDRNVERLADVSCDCGALESLRVGLQCISRRQSTKE